MGTVKLPGIGPVESKWVWAGGALVIGIAGYAYYRSSVMPVDDGATDDTLPEDSEAPTDGMYPTDYYDGGTPTYYPPGYYAPTPSTSDIERDPVTDTEWSGRAIEYLEDLNVDGQAAALAISRYLLKDCLTSSQADIVRMAVGRLGRPPQTGNSLNIFICQTTPPPGGGGTPTPTPISLKPPTGLKAVGKSRTSVTLDWDPLPGAKGYQVFMSGRRQTTVTYSGRWTKQGLKRNSVYKFQVFGVYRLPGKSSDTLGPGSTVISVRTSN